MGQLRQIIFRSGTNNALSTTLTTGQSHGIRRHCRTNIPTAAAAINATLLGNVMNFIQRLQNNPELPRLASPSNSSISRTKSSCRITVIGDHPGYHTIFTGKTPVRNFVPGNRSALLLSAIKSDHPAESGDRHRRPGRGDAKKHVFRPRYGDDSLSLSATAGKLTCAAITPGKTRKSMQFDLSTSGTIQRQG